MTDSADLRLKDVEGRIKALETQRCEQVLVVETKARRDQSTDEAEQTLRDLQAELADLHAERAALLQAQRRDS